MDTLASEYSWSKEHIFALYPAEINILMHRITVRRLQESRLRMLELSKAAMVPHASKRDRERWFDALEKHGSGGYDDGSGVTAESIKSQTSALLTRRKFNPPPAHGV